MRFEVKYGKARADEAEASFSPSRVLNDLAGLRDDEHYARYMAAYPIPVPARATAELRDQFVTAIEEANAGHLWHGLARDLERVRFDAPGRFDVPDIAAFGAWSVAYLLVTAAGFSIKRCETCAALWVSDDEEALCHRPAPGTGVTCRALAADRRFRERHEKFRRERRRLYERTRRGSLDQQTYSAWLAENRPGAWLPFEKWKESHDG